jgi:hypothetical protein
VQAAASSAVPQHCCRLIASIPTIVGVTSCLQVSHGHLDHVVNDDDSTSVVMCLKKLVALLLHMQ